ncbi:HAMP domain-containing histidine kinase [Nocardioidaceae bacterium]|nr:HAMP domain-containing histidine kinase [Nocardioidaceae bacterium]
MRAAAEWEGWTSTTRRVRLYLVTVGVGALVLPWLLLPLAPTPVGPPAPVTLLMLLAVAVFHIEVARVLIGGRVEGQQPHKALSAWALASALLLPPPMLLVVVVATYAHARWRGMRVPLWQWVFSGAFLVLAGCAALVVRHVVLGPGPLVPGDASVSGSALPEVTLALAALAFLTVEMLLFAGSALLNHAEQEQWLRGQLRSVSFYVTEAAVLVVGALTAVLWSAGPWFLLLALPLQVLAARAALLQPVRQRAAEAAVLAAENEVLAEANAFKVQLLSMLGHEVGNPLTSVIGWSQVATEAVEAGDLEGARDALTTAERSVRRTREVLADITAMVAADTGALSAHPETVELAPLLRDVGLPTTQATDETTVRVQPGHLHQILTNLASNAEKYAGGVTSLTAVAGPDGCVRIEVADGGVVPSDVRERLFERYARAETHSGLHGTGLGLAITRDLARANGGDVTYRPRYRDGRPGSVFTVILPGPGAVASPVVQPSEASPAANA